MPGVSAREKQWLPLLWGGTETEELVVKKNGFGSNHRRHLYT